MKRCVIISEADYQAIRALLKDLMSEASLLGSSYGVGRVLNRAKEIQELLKEDHDFSSK